MKCWIVDLDGTLLKHGDNELLPGAREFLYRIKESGDQLVITTRRGQEFEDHPVYNRESTLKALKELGVEYDYILFGIHSPRIVINDDGCAAINVGTNEGLENIQW